MNLQAILLQNNIYRFEPRHFDIEKAKNFTED
jgi:hypothetical protein